MRKLSIVAAASKSPNTPANNTVNSPTTSTSPATTIPQVLQLTEAADLPLMRNYERIVPPSVSKSSTTAAATPQTKQFFIDLFKHLKI
jgi:hypothetical protein